MSSDLFALTFAARDPVGLGATRVDNGPVLADPDGNEFCVRP